MFVQYVIYVILVGPCCKASVGRKRRWGRREDDAGAGAVCEVVTGGNTEKGGERVVPGWHRGRLFSTWEEGGEGAAQGGGRREAEVRARLGRTLGRRRVYREIVFIGMSLRDFRV